MATKKQPLFNEAEVDLLKRTALDVWNEIGGDILAVNGGKDMPRSAVVELVMDAGRISERLKQGVLWARSSDERRVSILTGKEIAARLDGKYDEALHRELERIVKSAFPAGRYGM